MSISIVCNVYFPLGIYINFMHIENKFGGISTFNNIDINTKLCQIILYTVAKLFFTCIAKEVWKTLKYNKINK